MPFSIARARSLLQSFNLRKLFIEEMGWDRPGPDLDIPFNDELLHLSGVAQKRGFMVFVCSPLPTGLIPDYASRRKIEAEIRKSVHEHIIIFTNADSTRQVWLWVRREVGRPTAGREIEYHRGHSGQALLERLQNLVFTLEEEEQLGIIDVASRVRATFDVERVTRRFYDRFKDEHAAFERFLIGIPDQGMQRWYVSVTLNRLMFVYFIQKKQFLNGDPDYLRNNLQRSRQNGLDRFYLDFLCPLFFEGFAKTEAERSPQMNRLLGKVPYLNGGIFQRHQIEQSFGKDIRIPDAAFERIFEFFDQYRWHLDERMLRDDREINPDVLGYIFEKYINQKQMGAYYTKEDITGYISKNTILPYLLDQTRKECPSSFQGPGSPWRLLAADPNRYVYASVQKGCHLPLPPNIQAGVHQVSQRADWNKSASEDFALPTEIWREVVARRTRYQELVQKLAGGQVNEVNDLITFNLDIQQFAQDLVESTQDPELLRAFWKALINIKVLDPTCGSGAFLFAALNILEPLYDACLERMRAFLVELDQSAENHRPEKFNDFRAVLQQVEQHPNLSYFILKSIIVHNLYGVDIMEEAVEICKLRLFLKLVAQVESVEKIEPLPDIDFNIRAGNTLVGFTSIDEVRQAIMSSGAQYRMLYPEEEAQILRIQEEADLANRAYLQFQRLQVENGLVTQADKAELRRRLDSLNSKLNHTLAKVYNIHPTSLDFAPWLEGHKPFHWLVDFYGIMSRGGFDVIIGNPPYVEYRKIRNNYTVRNLYTENSNNLYSFCMERSLKLLKSGCRFGMIVPVSSISGESYRSLFDLFSAHSNWISSFSNRPGKLFKDVEQRLAIFISQLSEKTELFTTNYQHWYEAFRDYLFQQLEYYPSIKWEISGHPIKTGDPINTNIFKKIVKTGRSAVLATIEFPGSFGVWYHNGPTYWVRSLPFEPKGNTQSGRSNHYLKIRTKNTGDAYIISSVMSSSTYYLFFKLVSNCRDLGKKEWSNYPLGKLSEENARKLIDLGNQLEILLQKTSANKSRLYASGYIEYDEYYPAKGIKVINEIDQVLKRHYDFSEDEFDHLINYNIKYRLSTAEEEE